MLQRNRVHIDALDSQTEKKQGVGYVRLLKGVHVGFLSNGDELRPVEFIIGNESPFT